MDAAGLLAAKSLRETTLTVDVEGGVELTLRALPRKEYRVLLDEHPPVEDGKDWNGETFPPALIAACVVEPVFTLQQATQLWDEWEAGDAARVFLTCFNLNEQSAGVGFTLPGSAKTGGSGQNSTTALEEE